MANILIADDDKEIIKLLRMYLEKDHHNIYEAYDGEMAFIILKNYEIDVALLDVMMPQLSGYELLKQIRSIKDIPVMFISAKTNINDRVLGLELGAEDYITKPFEPLEVVAKVNARLRRKNGASKAEESDSDRTLKVRNLTLLLDECMIQKYNQNIELTKVEFGILKLFMTNPGRVFTKEQIYSFAWGDDYVVDDNTIRVVMSKLRDKVGSENIKTIRGLGYRMEKI